MQHYIDNPEQVLVFALLWFVTQRLQSKTNHFQLIKFRIRNKLTILTLFPEVERHFPICHINMYSALLLYELHTSSLGR